MRAFAMFALVVIAVPDRQDPTPREAKPPHEQIVGDWRYISNAKDAAPQQGTPDFVFRILPNESIWIDRGKPSPGNGFTAKVSFDWTKTPVHFDLKPNHGGSVIEAILKLDGDRLTMGWSNGPRPADFATAVHLHHFTRVRP